MVAWINGRMMLLSTLFALASLLALRHWLETGRVHWCVWTILLVAMSGISKIRIGLPLLMFLVPLARGRRFDVRFWVVWLISAALSAVLVWVNMMATAEAGMFAGAEDNLRGPLIVRMLLSLAFYFQHYVWPTGLASWYPTPVEVSWTGARELLAMGIVALATALTGLAVWRWRITIRSVWWFLATIAVTLALVQTRNALAADRYMYLPIVGFAWLTGIATCSAYHWCIGRWAPWKAKAGLGVVWVVGVAAMLAVSWHVMAIYATPLSKVLRIATLHPETPHVWERVAWSYYDQGRYDEAIETAGREFEHDNRVAQGAAYQVIGMSYAKMGQHDLALEHLRKAVGTEPKNPRGWYRRGRILEENGQFHKARECYEEAVRLAPKYNPALNKLGRLCHQLGLIDDARRAYTQSLGNNRFEVRAIMGLAQLDLESGSPADIQSAIDLLTGLLSWLPEHTEARTNLGAALHAAGDVGGAIRAYGEVLSARPGHATAALNLGQIYLAKGDIPAALTLASHAAVGEIGSVAEAIGIHDLFVACGAPEEAMLLWQRITDMQPDSRQPAEFLIWSTALAGETAQAKRLLAIADNTTRGPLRIAGAALVALQEGRYDDAIEKTDALAGTGSIGMDARHRFLGALQRFDFHHPDIPWTIHLVAQLMLADNKRPEAQMCLELFAQRCQTDTCAPAVEALRARLGG